MELAKDKYADLEIAYSNLNKKVNKRSNIRKWMEKHVFFTAIVAFTLTFSIINIILIMKFFSILANL